MSADPPLIDLRGVGRSYGAGEALVQGCFAGPGRLLEMLWFDEQAFGPENGIA